MSTLKRYEHLAEELAQAIRDGRLPGGSALPTHRAFAQQRRIGLSTATRTYAELQRQGLIVGEVGRGTFVRERPVAPGPLSEAVRYTSRARTAQAIGAPTLREALRTLAGLPDIERLAAQASPLGSPSVRRALATHLGPLGLAADPARIVATAGGMAAMRLAALLTTERGQRVAVDAVTYPGWRLVCEQLGLEAVPLPFDRAGPVPDNLERLLRRKRIAALHCMPTAHHPLGWVMPLERRRDIVALARAHGVALLEDATYHYLARRPPPLLAQLAPERTWLVGSLSGAMGDGLRLGYVVAPGPQEARLEKAALSWGLAAPPLVSELARLWLGDGTIASLQSAQREHAQRLWKAAAAAGLGALSPSSCGWLMWLPLPRGVRAEDVVSALRHQGIDALGSGPFATTRHLPHAVAVRLRAMTAVELAAAAPAIRAACG